MKKLLILLTAVLLCASLCACQKEVETFNEAVGYNFEIPEDWTCIRSDGVVELQYDCNEAEDKAEYATIAANTFTLNDEQADFGSKNYWEFYKNDYLNVLKDYKELDYKEIELDGTKAVKVKYSFKPDEKTYVSEQVICCRYGEVFFVTLTSPEEYKDDVSGALAAVIETFKFKD